ncbi:MAG: sensor histidine kinase [Nitrospirota bacterium]
MDVTLDRAERAHDGISTAARADHGLARLEAPRAGDDVFGALARECAVAEERRVIAGELHDGVAQSVAALSVQAATVHSLLARGAVAGARRELAAMREVIADADHDVRRMLAELRTVPAAYHGSFAGALDEQIAAFGRRTGLRVELTGKARLAALSAGQQAEVFRIIREALANVRKHAGARRVRIACERDNGRCVVRITDDGVGFDPAAMSESDGRSVGTSMLRERAAKARGRLTIESRPGRGTTVSVSVPVAAADERSA